MDINSNKEYLNRRIKHLKDLWNDPHRLALNYNPLVEPLGSLGWAFDSAEFLFTLVHLDNSISRAIIEAPLDREKLLFRTHKLIPSSSVVTNFTIGDENGKHWIADYCFFSIYEGVQYPYAIGIDIMDTAADETLDIRKLHFMKDKEWYFRMKLEIIDRPEKTIEIKYEEVPIFFVTPSHIFTFNNIHTFLRNHEENANIITNNEQFKEWLEYVQDDYLKSQYIMYEIIYKDQIKPNEFNNPLSEYIKLMK
jgi:hypothetical protein